jgi:hypothetical protein
MPFFGGLNYPDDPTQRDQYFRECFALIRTVNQLEKVRKVVASYIRYAMDPALHAELQQFLRS